MNNSTKPFLSPARQHPQPMEQNMTNRFRLFTLFTFAASLTLLGAANLVDNGELTSDQTSTPDNWAMSSHGATYQRTGGPAGAPVITVRDSPLFTLRQQGITLIPGETYRLSAQVRTAGFSCEKGLLVVHNASWQQDHGIRAFPADSDWQRLEATFAAPTSRDKFYGVALSLSQTRGELAIADIRLEALTPRGEQESFSPIGSIKERFLVPLSPNLAAIPADQAELLLHWAYPAEPGTAGEISLDRGTSRSLPLDNRQLKVPLQGLGQGPHHLLARLLSPAGEELGRCETAFTLVPPVPAATGSKRLNNLVTELVNRPLNPGERNLTFINPRAGWIFLALEKPGDAVISLNGESFALFQTPAGAWETMRRRPAGEQVLILPEGASGTLVIRTIPALFKYPVSYNSYVPGNGPYDWDFHRKHVFDACTILNGAVIPPEYREEARARGLEWFSNLGVSRDVATLNASALQEKIAASVPYTDPAYQGVTADELFFYRSVNGLVNYAAALQGLNTPASRTVYTWFVGIPSIGGLHHHFISSSMNAAEGRGVMLFEAYCQPQADAEQARIFAENKIVTLIRQMNAYMPDASSKLGIILGNFNQIPIISLDHRPDVDMKYYLDQQMQIMANHPDCRDLSVVGYWGCQYADEEILRWSMRLLRHYAVEGETTLLSSRHGYAYTPGLLQNGAFTQGLQHWQATGNIRPDSHPGFGKNSLRLWSGQEGDTFAVFTSGETPNALQQNITGLTPGQLYSLQFAVASYPDVVNNVIRPRRLPFRAQLDGVDILRDKSYIHVDSRSQSDKTAFPRINLHRTVFRAAATTHSLLFSDGGRPAEELILSHIQVKPYFEN